MASSWCVPNGLIWPRVPPGPSPMPKLREVCHVRSKNAGPFWVTVDLFFRDQALYFRYRDAPTLGPALFERHFGVLPEQVKRLPVDGLCVIKISFPRAQP